MDPLGQQIKKITSELKDYLETRFELLVLNVSEQFTKWIGEAIQHLVGFAVLGLGLLFALIAVGFYLGGLLDNNALGFAIVSAPILIAGLIMIIIKPKAIARNIQNQFMAEVLIAFKEKEAMEEAPTTSNLLNETNREKDAANVEA